MVKWDILKDLDRLMNGEKSPQKNYEKESKEKKPISNKEDKKMQQVIICKDNEIDERDIVTKIIDESHLKDKINDKSILDLDNKTKGEIYYIIDDYSNKKDLALKFINAMPCYYDKAGLWWIWSEKNKKYILGDEVDLLNILNFCAGINIIKSKERTEIINALKQQARQKDPIMPKSSWIQFNQEIIDIKTGERFEATSKYFFTNPIPYNLGKNEDTPTMDKIFSEWVGEKYVKTLYEIIAYCLIPDYPIHRLFCFYGEGMNGKSCFLNLLRKFVGENNVCSTELDLLMGSRFEITRCHKKLICQMGETNFNEMNKTSIIKKLTGGDLIGFEYKGKNPFEEKNYAKIIISTNNLPTTNDKTLGFYRRWLIIDFPNRFNEKKNILEDIPESEYNNLAMKSIAILIELLKKREFTNEGSVEDRMKKFEEKSNPLDKFLKEFCLEDIDKHIWKYDFEKKFNEWCKQNRFRQFSDVAIGKEMKIRGYEPVKKTATWLNDGKGGQLRAWSGLKWIN